MSRKKYNGKKSVALITAYGHEGISSPLIQFAKYLSSKDYEVDIYISGIRGGDAMGISIREFSETNIRIIRTPEKSRVIKKLSYYIKNIFPINHWEFILRNRKPQRNYDFIVGFDPDALYRARYLSFFWKNPFIYYSLEIEDTSGIRKRREIKCSKKAFLTITQDKIRAQILSDLNNTPIEKIFSIYNSSLGSILTEKKDYFREKFSIDKNKKIFLVVGTLHQVHGVDKILSIANMLNKTTVLVLHGWLPTLEMINLVEDTIKAYPDKVFLSTEILHPDEKFLVYQSADIGFIYYEPINSNLKFASGSSGKLFDFIRAGVPVITYNLPGLKELVTDNNIGLTFNDFRQIPECIKIIDSNYTQYRENAFSAFKKTDVKKDYAALLSKIEKECCHCIN